MDCRVCVSGGDVWKRGGGQIGASAAVALSYESERDLGSLVTDFWENGSVGAESWCSSDSDTTHSDLAHLADKIPFYKCSEAQYENDLASVVHSLILSITAKDLLVKSGTCNANCVKYSLVKLLRLSGYDAAVCLARWQGSGKVPGGDHEYIDVVNHSTAGSSERLIIDIDFRSHFEIARAVQSYDRILNSLPVVYVGSLTRLKQFLQVMVDAAKSSLKQNSMPVPPWRQLAYLQSKWQSPYQRQFNLDEHKGNSASLPFDHKQCSEHLQMLQSLLQSEIEADRLLKPISNDNNIRRHKPARRQSCRGT